MKLESDGILIAMRPINERDALAHIFSRDYGIVAGVMRGAVVAKKNKPLVGQVGTMSWNARLDSQLGIFHWDVDRNMVANLMLKPNALMAMNSAFSLIDTFLPEREAYSDLYQATIDLVEGLANFDTESVYLGWEIKLLHDLGYALDLSRCSGCGVTHDLNYLSPKTGRAVCDNCARPYLNKLYKLPLNLNVSLRFLENVCVQQGVELPVMRTILKNI